MELASEILGNIRVYTERDRANIIDYAWDVLVFDPGQMIGWAGYNGTSISAGQFSWEDFICETQWKAQRVVIERTPYASQRTFDQWPILTTGMMMAHVYPQEPEYVLPTNLKVARKWYSLPRGAGGLGRHAKDALSHLVYTLVMDQR